jgi:hypothetical protein
MIYVIAEKNDADGPVKIGYTAGAACAEAAGVRLRELQCGTWRELAVLAVCEGTARDERELHRRFADARLRGEWFRRTDELSRFICEHRCEPVTPAYRRPRPIRIDPSSIDQVSEPDAHAAGLVDIAHMSNWFECSATTVHRMVADGMPAFRIAGEPMPRALRFDVDSVEGWFLATSEHCLAREAA